MKTLVAGGSTNPDRYSFQAIHSLKKHGHEVVSLGNMEGLVEGVEIKKGLIPYTDIHTITMYLNANNQKQYYDYFLSLNPKRIIFNPGAENPELEHLASNKGIIVEEGCTLVMLSIGVFDKLV